MSTVPTAAKRTALLGICGGVAAYKAVEVASRLRRAGWDVYVAMSDAAQRFVAPLTFAAVTGNPVLDSLFPEPGTQQGDRLYPHLFPATTADAFVLLPATADMIARIAHGLGSDIVSTSALSLPASCRRYVCPAMNVEMWNQPVVRANIAALESMGWTRIGPSAGALACGMEGEGRMTEPVEIAELVTVASDSLVPLAGRTVLVISGPTREHLDPVRFIGNPSTGKMGKAVAESAAGAGAKVEFVTGPVADDQLPRGPGIRVHRVTSAAEMLDAARRHYPEAEVVVYAAAVADYRPARRLDRKMPKQAGRHVLELEATPDIAATLNAGKRKGQVAIGFALQTHDGAKNARAKLSSKNFDGIVLNDLDALAGETGTYTWLAAPGRKPARAEPWGTITKRACARRLLEAACTALRRT
jgi:phosphopantothenoylcysteine decarboxylase/phosphopantothenate--cysteine ligase